MIGKNKALREKLRKRMYARAMERLRDDVCKQLENGMGSKYMEYKRPVEIDLDHVPGMAKVEGGWEQDEINPLMRDLHIQVLERLHNKLVNECIDLAEE